jgi:hypothetical protein
LNLRDIADRLFDPITAPFDAAPLPEKCDDLVATKLDEFLGLQPVPIELLGPEGRELPDPFVARVEPIL